MKANSRLSLALHALGHLARDMDRSRTSEEIARHNDTNPVVVRRVLGHLRKAGIVESRKGAGGGWRLVRAPEAVTLADVYAALGESLLNGDADDRAKTRCGIEAELQSRVDAALEDAERRLLERLSASTLAQLAQPDH